MVGDSRTMEQSGFWHFRNSHPSGFLRTFAITGDEKQIDHVRPISTIHSTSVRKRSNPFHRRIVKRAANGDSRGLSAPT